MFDLHDFYFQILRCLYKLLIFKKLLNRIFNLSIRLYINTNLTRQSDIKELELICVLEAIINVKDCKSNVIVYGS